jgi:UDP-glucuronate decarboxylase
MGKIAVAPRPTNTAAVVAGGAGFVGSHLCRQLIQDGCRVYCVDNFDTGAEENLLEFVRESRFELIEQDVCSPLPKSLPADAIYNLACPASPEHYQADPIHTMMTSVLGTRNLLDHAQATSARYLQASTSEVYGDPECHPQTEDYWGHVNPVGPRACYDEGKRAGETLCFDYLRLGRVDARVARIFNTYGPRMQIDDGRIVSNLVCQALQGKPLTIYGNGNQTRSFCYVSDMVRGLLALMNVSENPHRPMNLGNPGEFTINELADLVRAMTGTTSKIVFRPLPTDDPRRRRPEISQAKEILHWSPKISLPRGLKPTIAYFDKRLRSMSRGVSTSERLVVAGKAGSLAGQGA